MPGLRLLGYRDRKELLAEFRPRFITLTIRTERFTLRWALPLWVIEELLAFALGLAPLLPGLSRYLPEKARKVLDTIPKEVSAGDPLQLIDNLFRQRRDLLRLPPGEVFVRIQTPEVFLEVGQW